jgi:hypothetical protein
LAVAEGPEASPAPPWPPNGRQVVLAIGRVDPADIASMCERARSLLGGSDAEVLVCDLAGVDPDAAAVDLLARLRLVAGRLGRELRVRHARGELRDLLALAGLADVVRCDDLPLEPRGQAEQREQPRGVQEERDPADPVP